MKADEQKWTTAEKFLQKARKLEPENENINKSLASVLAWRGDEAYRLNDLKKARADFEKALRYDPQNSKLKIMLSQIVYRMEGSTQEANGLLEEGLKGNPDESFREQKMQFFREMEIEKQTREIRHGNWILRFQEDLMGVDPKRIFDLIQEVSDFVGEDFEYWIKHRLVFVLVDQMKFEQIHSGPDWAAALNDGRIKIPFSSGLENEKQFKAVLAHEYTHSVINDLSAGYPVPFWFHEGLARYEEDRIRGVSLYDSRYFLNLAQVYKSQSYLPFEILNDPLAAEKIPPSFVPLAYEQSLSFVLYIKDKFRFYPLLSFLKNI